MVRIGDVLGRVHVLESIVINYQGEAYL
jgi:hypothetical protein